MALRKSRSKCELLPAGFHTDADRLARKSARGEGKAGAGWGHDFTGRRRLQAVLGIVHSSRPAQVDVVRDVLSDLPPMARQNLFERFGLGQVHVAHRLIVAAQRWLALCWRHQLERWRNSQIVPGPRAAEEAALPKNDALAHVRLGYGSNGLCVKRERCRAE